MKRFFSIIAAALCSVNIFVIASPVISEAAVYGEEENYNSLTYITVDEEGDGVPDSIRIVDCDTSAVSVTVPSVIAGLPVKRIENAFQNKSKLKSVTISEGVAEIGTYAFSACTALEDITLPNSLVKIDSNAFLSCYKLEAIQIPAKVSEIGKSVFSHCKILKKIEVDPGNANFSSVDGVLFNKKKTLLIQYPLGKSDEEYSVPSGVTDIGYDSFSSNSNLKRITFPEGLKAIGPYAFETCKQIEEITLPLSLESIDYQVFRNCTALKKITIKSPECSIYNSSHTISNKEVYDYDLQSNKGYYSGVIFGQPGSTAQEYASKWGYSFEPMSIIKGDVNFDGSVDIYDAIRIARTLIPGSEPLKGNAFEAGDYDSDGDMDLYDLISVARTLIS